MEPLALAKLLERMGEVIADRLAQGELFGIPGLGVFYVRHMYGRKVGDAVIPHKGYPKFQFSHNIKKATAQAPNKGTPRERHLLKTRPIKTTTAARRRSELPGGYYLTRVGTLASIGSHGSGPVPTRRRTDGAQAGFSQRLKEVEAKRRFKQSLKRAAKAAG
jgi:nucleoid DNA-binding protein